MPHRRRLAAVLLVAAVFGLHLWLAEQTLEAQLGFGDAGHTPAPLAVAFVHTLEPTAPPTAPAVRRRRRAPPPPAAPSSAASAAAVAEAASTPAPAAEIAQPTPDAAPPGLAASDAGTPAAPATVASEPSSAASAAPAPGFEWPPSTRLSYALTGNYRGPVEGQAQVEWLHIGTRYQVHVDLSIGPFFAPLLWRRHSSEGEITAQGLRPQRYDEDTRVLLRSPRHLTMRLDDEVVHLVNGKTVPRPEGVQDSASQFVQLVWLFTTRPALLTPGQRIDIPLALPRYVDTWTYEVLAHETLATPVGPIDTVHVKPRREPRPGSELQAEMWVAPTLQYLPVRILIRQDAQTYVDLTIVSLPLQAAPANGPPASTASPGDRP